MCNAATETRHRIGTTQGVRWGHTARSGPCADDTARGTSVESRSEGRTIEAVLDERLVGYWSDEDLYQGDMEAADIAFRSDGTGWTYWSRDGGSFYVLRFGWHTDASRDLTLDLHENLSGAWDLRDHTTVHRVASRTPHDKQIVLAYEITEAQNILRKPATLLQLDRQISMGTIGDRFAFKRDLASTEHDPTTRSPEKPPSVI
jgi:hypothetical protein